MRISVHIVGWEGNMKYIAFGGTETRKGTGEEGVWDWKGEEREEVWDWKG